jgi:RNA polymerase sigma-B factor
MPTTAAPDARKTTASEALEDRARRDRMLFARRDRGDLRARAELIERFLPLARSLARRYENSGEPLEDLVQVASLALVRAVDRYDSTRGHAFSSYAVPSIVGELKRHFRDRSWTIRPPRELQELTLRVERASSQLSQALDRAPTVRELATELGVSDERVLDALQAGSARGALSLQATGRGGDGEAMLQDRLGVDDDGYGHAEERGDLDRLLACLPARQREVLRLRFEEDLTQAEIGERLGVSQMQISRLVRLSINQLRHVADQQRMLQERPSSVPLAACA